MKGLINMAAKPTMLTEEGLRKLEEELEYLHNVKRKEIAEKIKVARSYGDLSENSEYDDAKNEQAIMEARITTIESILKTAVIIDESYLLPIVQMLQIPAIKDSECVCSIVRIEYKCIINNSYHT